MPTRRSRMRRLIGVSLCVCAALLFSGCSLSEATTLDPQGDHAQRIYDLLIPIFWAGLAVFVFVEGVLLYSVLRFRRRPNTGLPAQTHGNLRIEILWTIAPALIVLVIAILTFRTQAANSVQPADALQIEAIGKQWYFSFVYPQQKGISQEIITATDMYIPVGRPVTVRLTGADVIHSFWVPKLAGKTDMIPSLTNYLSFTARKPGLYRGQCAELCGAQHAQMGFNVIALEPEAFDRWVAQQSTPPPGGVVGGAPTAAATAAAGQPATTAQAGATAAARAPTPVPTAIPQQLLATPAPQAASVAPPTTGDPENGRLLFEKKACIGCHVVGNDPSSLSKLGPNLAYYGSRTEIAAGILPNTNENLAKWLHDPAAIKPENKMSSVVMPGYLSDKEIADLVAYLNGMKVPVDVPVAAK